MPVVVRRPLILLSLAVTAALVLTTADVPRPQAASAAVTAPVLAAKKTPACRGPVTITRGGRYSGCFKSTRHDVPAITVRTTAPVVLDRVSVHHKGTGIASGVRGVRLTVKNTTFSALRPGRRVKQRAIKLVAPASFVAENNRLVNGMGIWVGSGSDAPHKVSPLRIRFNDATNIGRWGDPDCCVQFVQFHAIRAKAEIAWNRVTNQGGRSNMEDAINMYKSGGAGPNARVDIHHNLINGAYDLGNAGGGYTGGGIIAGDGGGNWTTIRDNRVVSTSNYGVAIVGGNNNQLLRNRVVNDGRSPSGRRHGPSYSVGVPVWQPLSNVKTGPGVRVVGNVIGWNRPDGKRNDTWIAVSAKRGGNKLMRGRITSATERAEVRAWWSAVRRARVKIGPRR